MSEDFASYLMRRRDENKDKFTHLQLAITAAAIGFTVDRTIGRSISWSQIPLAAAVALWCFSFLSGCRVIVARDEADRISMEGLLAKRANESDPTKPYDEADFLRRAANTLQLVAFRHRQQFDSLAAGAFMFVAWHIGEMILTPAA